MSLTTAQVQAIYAAEVARGKNAKDARQGTRTTVQAMLHADSPTPYSDRPALVQAAELERRGLTQEEKQALLAHQYGQVTDADRIASEKAREGADGSHKDALHFVQKQHQANLWKQADALVIAALGAS
jgi:hypothetical protein